MSTTDELLRAMADAPALPRPRIPVTSESARPVETTASRGDDRAAIEVAPPELVVERWGTRFTSPSTETSYRAWHRTRAIPFTRVAMLLSVLTWSLGAAAFAYAHAAHFAYFAVEVFGGLIPLFVLTFALTYVPRLRRWLVPSIMLANLLAGGAAVLGAYSQLNLPELGIAVICIVGFYAFTIVPLLPAEAVLAVLPYFVLSQWTLIDAFADRGGALVLYSTVQWFAFISGAVACVVVDRISREGYRQNRIVDAQRTLIDRLQRAEVQRQVAERSRDLSHALARLAEAPHASARLAVGDIVDSRYRVVRMIGAGGMGRVYEIDRLADSRRLALKVMTGVADPRDVARFAREAQLAAELDHPHTVPVIDVGVTADGMLFLAMPLVAGSSLDRARDRYGEIAWARGMIAQIAAALVAMHERGIVHRDLKPANVLLDGDRVKVADFGIASVMAGAPGEATPDGDTQLAPAAPLTRAGHFIGTPLYMAPELADHARGASAASDVFSLGVIAYELLSRKLPHAAPPIYDRLAGRATERPPPLATLAPELPRELAALVDRCLVHVPEQRPSAHELAAAFHRAEA